MAENSFVRTALCIFCMVPFVCGLYQPSCEIDIQNPSVDDVITLTCSPHVNDSRENITLTWFHDGKNISLEQTSGIVRTKLSSADYGVSFSCRESDVAHMEERSCSLMPLQRVTIPTPERSNADATEQVSPDPPFMPSTTESTESHDKRQGTITILFIAIIVAGGLPILVAFIACIVWISRKTMSEQKSYDLKQRPRSDSFDDFDTEAAVESRAPAPLPGEVQAMNLIKNSSVKSMKNGTPPVLKSLTQKEAVSDSVGPEYYAPPAETGTDSLYQNTAMGNSSTLPVKSTPKNPNVYLVPKCSTIDSQESLGEDKIYENTPSKQTRFEADHTASLPYF